MKRATPCCLVQQCCSVLGHWIESSVPSPEVVQVPDEVLSLLEASAAAAERLYFDSFVNSTTHDGTSNLHSDGTTTKQPTHYRMRPHRQGRRTPCWAAVAPCLTTEKLESIPKLLKFVSVTTSKTAGSLIAGGGAKQCSLTARQHGRD